MPKREKSMDALPAAAVLTGRRGLAEHGTDDGAGVAVSSRIRLARNLRGAAFPGWAGGRERKRLFAEIAALVADGSLLDKPSSVLMDDLDGIGRDILIERHLISAELASGGPGAGLACDRNARLSIMINEEDHLRLQALEPGLNLQRAWAAVDRLDTGLERHLSYAFSPTLGYLTACPSNVGTGMRASVMMHLAGLRLLGEAEQVAQGLNRTGFAVRGSFGEGSEAFGGLYQISNQTSLGVGEVETLARLEDMVRTLVQLERNARQRLDLQHAPRLADHIGRAFGTLAYAGMLSAGEAMDIISGLRLGLEFGMISGIDETRLADAMLLIQPGHLQREAKKSLSAAERDIFRAGYIRGLMTGAKLTEHL